VIRFANSFISVASFASPAFPAARRCVEALRAKGVACRALVKDSARAANLLPQPTTPANSSSSSTSSTGPEFDIMTGDVYQYATLPRAFAGCDAVIVASAANDKSDPFGPFKIDYQGTLNLIAAAKRAGVKRFVFVTSIGADDPFNPLNLFWGVSCCCDAVVLQRLAT
jgi:uncharacterized protein YbjT (DUF2867 family)